MADHGWAHSCCTAAALAAALEDPAITAIESDICISSRTGQVAYFSLFEDKVA